MAYVLLPDVFQQIFDVNGDPAVGYTMRFYEYNTTTPVALYSSASGTPLGVSCTLNSRGAPQTSGGTEVSLYGDTNLISGYKIVLEDADGGIVRTYAGPIYPPVSGAWNTTAIDGMADSMSALVGGSWSGYTRVKVASFYGGWAPTTAGPKGASWWHFDGTTSGTPTTNTSASIIAAMASGRVISADGRGWMLDRDQVWHVYQFGAQAAGEVTQADDTAAVQSAIDFLSDTLGGGDLHYPSGQANAMFFNVTCKRYVNHIGSTSWVYPKTNSPLFTIKANQIVYGVTFKGFRSVGNGANVIGTVGSVAWTNATFLYHVPAAGYYADTIKMEDCHLESWGGCGVFMYGREWDGANTGYMQKFSMENCEIYRFRRSGLYIGRAVIEAQIENCIIAGNGDNNNPAVGGYNNYLSGSAGFANVMITTVTGYPPGRIAFRSCVINQDADGTALTSGVNIYVYGCQNLEFDQCDFEAFYDCWYTTFNQTRNLHISNCRFAVGNNNIRYIVNAETLYGLRWENNFIAANVVGTAAINLGFANNPQYVRNVCITGDNNWGVIQATTVAPFYTVGANVFNDEFTSSAGAADTLNLYQNEGVFIVYGSGGAADELKSIFDNDNGLKKFKDGAQIIIRPLNSTATITVKHNTGNIRLFGAADVLLDQPYKQVLLTYDQRNSVWVGGSL